MYLWCLAAQCDCAKQCCHAGERVPGRAAGCRTRTTITRRSVAVAMEPAAGYSAAETEKRDRTLPGASLLRRHGITQRLELALRIRVSRVDYSGHSGVIAQLVHD